VGGANERLETLKEFLNNLQDEIDGAKYSIEKCFL
jgi:hypothetical protein